MNIEKLIEQLNGYFEGKELGRGAALDAATVLSTFQAENEKLQKMYQEEKVVCHATQVELEKVRESLDFARTKDAEILRLGMELGRLKKHMERLTHRLGNGEITCNMARDDCRKMGGDCQIDSKILDRLAAYEKTGLELEDFKRAFTEDALLKLTGQLLGVTPDRLRELAQADREGRCVALPIKPGTPVWSTAFCRVDDDGTEHPTYPWPFDLSMAEEWGREWFLTREEAEKALEGTKNG